jgi:Mobilization protein NikA
VKRSHQVACYLNDEELAQLKAQVAKSGVTLSRYLKERALGNDQPEPRPQTGTSDPQNGAFEALLNENERRIAQQVAAVTDKSAREVLSRLSLLATMLDQFARTMLIHTPEIPHDRQKSAGESGERRHRNWRRMVAEILSDMEGPEQSEVESRILAEQITEARQ